MRPIDITVRHKSGACKVSLSSTLFGATLFGTSNCRSLKPSGGFNPLH